LPEKDLINGQNKPKRYEIKNTLQKVIDSLREVQDDKEEPKYQLS